MASKLPIVLGVVALAGVGIYFSTRDEKKIAADQAPPPSNGGGAVRFPSDFEKESLLSNSATLDIEAAIRNLKIGSGSTAAGPAMASFYQRDAGDLTLRATPAGSNAARDLLTGYHNVPKLSRLPDYYYIAPDRTWRTSMQDQLSGNAVVAGLVRLGMYALIPRDVLDLLSADRTGASINEFDIAAATVKELPSFLAKVYGTTLQRDAWVILGAPQGS